MLFFGFPFFGIILLFMVFGLAMRLLRKFFIKSDRPRTGQLFGFDDEFFIPGQTAFESPQEGIENRIFRLAYDMKGRLTLSDVVVGTNLAMKQAEDYMNHLADGVHVKMEVDDDGMIFYDFPEIKRRLELR